MLIGLSGTGPRLLLRKLSVWSGERSEVRQNARVSGKAAKGGAKESSPFFPCVSPHVFFRVARDFSRYPANRYDSLFADNKFCVHMHLNRRNLKETVLL